jgi:hypothetical protein
MRDEGPTFPQANSCTHPRNRKGPCNALGEIVTDKEDLVDTTNRARNVTVKDRRYKALAPNPPETGRLP